MKISGLVRSLNGLRYNNTAWALINLNVAVKHVHVGQQSFFRDIKNCQLN